MTQFSKYAPQGLWGLEGQPLEDALTLHLFGIDDPRKLACTQEPTRRYRPVGDETRGVLAYDAAEAKRLMGVDAVEEY